MQLPALAEPVEHGRLVVAAVEVGVEEAEAALEHGGRTGDTLAGKGSGGDAAVRRPAAVHALDRAAGAVGLDHAGAHARGDTHGGGDLVGVEAVEQPGRHRRAERAADRGGVEALLEEQRVADLGEVRGHADPVADLDSRRDGGDELGGGGVDGLGRGQRGRHDRGAGVQHRRQVGVVEVQGVRERAVDQRRAAARAAAPRLPMTPASGVPAPGGHRAQHGPVGLGEPAAPWHSARPARQLPSTSRMRPPHRRRPPRAAPRRGRPRRSRPAAGPGWAQPSRPPLAGDHRERADRGPGGAARCGAGPARAAPRRPSRRAARPAASSRRC